LGSFYRIPSKIMIITADKLPNMHSTEFRGIPVVIQWPKGSTRVGERKDGTPFKTEMKADYGYVPNTIASGDEERLDVYIGPNKESDTVYVIEQARKDTGEFDEYKVMLGFDSLEEAEEMYEYHIKDGDVQLDDIGEVPFDYIFDKVMAEVGADNQVEKDELHKEIEHDEEKVAADDKMTVIEAFVKNYKHTYDFYEEVAKHAAQELEEALQEAGIRAIVTSRAKRPRKLRVKLMMRDQKAHYQSFRDIYADIVDLAGVRVALYLPADRMAVGEIIEKVFAPVRAPKQFPRDAGQGESLGYVATHHLVQLRPETLHKDELRYADTNIEIQVASVLMHSWAEVTHDLIYKPTKGTLTPEEMKMIEDLNVIVQDGESKLTQLQLSVEGRRGGQDLRFELTAHEASFTALAERLAAQSKGQAKVRIGALDVFRVARQAALGGKIEAGGSAFDSYLKAKLAIWKVHKADELDDRLRAYNESLKKTLPPTAPGDEVFVYQALEQLHPGTKDVTSLPSKEQSDVYALSQELKRQAQS
jgi:ppGpp synthetase/RelA/SpoT-type nucleotidyltranferase